MTRQIPQQRRSRFRGRRHAPSFLALPHYVITSPQWRALSGATVKFLVELAAAYNGSNNGDLALTRTQALTRGWRSGETRDNAAEEAEAAGFVVVTRHGHKGACTLYAITWQPIDDVGKGTLYGPEHKPSRLWERKEPLPRNWRALAQESGKAA